MTFSELLSALGMETRLDLSAAAAAGACTIQFDKKLDLVLEADAGGDLLQLHVAIADAPETNRANFFAALLQLHLFGLATDGGVFGFDPQRNRVLFFKTLSLSSLQVSQALKLIETFVNQAERWRDHLLEAASKMSAPTASPISRSIQRA